MKLLKSVVQIDPLLTQRIEMTSHPVCDRANKEKRRKCSDTEQQMCISKYYHTLSPPEHHPPPSNPPHLPLRRKYSKCRHVWFGLEIQFRSPPVEIFYIKQNIWLRVGKLNLDSFKIQFLARATVGTSLYVWVCQSVSLVSQLVSQSVRFCFSKLTLGHFEIMQGDEILHGGYT